ncbi:hypothetical protein PENTCL1PPCAC_9546 [Pristionchus entomophagus]|uniref:Uncharacterized protein n=1 Tax=Pristionchus entomophagus TaxID=358040 RepID=A0AAV5SVJ4_9BILA|nr:hypothetical protein PENTCL1PPCAC_9546 [Pristionchus entomophagus]
MRRVNASDGVVDSHADWPQLSIGSANSSKLSIDVLRDVIIDSFVGFRSFSFFMGIILLRRLIRYFLAR